MRNSIKWNRQEKWHSMLAVLIVALSSWDAHAAQLHMIGVVPTSEDDPLFTREVSEARALSADGKTVVGQLFYGEFRGAFRWTNDEGFTDVGDLSERFEGMSVNLSQLRGVTNDGRIAVGSSFTDDGQNDAAIKWKNGLGLVELSDLPGGVYSSFAMDVSANGDVVVGGANDENDTNAVRWNADGGIERLPGGRGYIATGVSADGKVAIGYSYYGGTVGMVWDENRGSTPIGYLPGGDIFNYPLGISADGSTVVGYSGGGAYKWTKQTGIVGLGLLPGGVSHSRATGVNADGSVIVGTSNSSDANEEGYIWNERDGMVSIRRLLIQNNIDVTGWTFDRPVGISDDGLVILGNGYFEDKAVAWLINLSEVPEPCTAFMFFAGLLILLGAAQRRKKGTRSPGPL